MHILFMGTGEIALPTLRWLLDEAPARGDELVAVYTQPDKPVGRRQELAPPAVKILAQGRGVAVRQPERLRGDEAALREFASFAPDLVVVMAYGQILPRALLEVPKLACVNLHASLLPRHRGAAPIQAAIRDGDRESGLTLMHIAARLDAGDMILKRAIPLRDDETGGALHDRLAELGPGLIAEGLELLRSGGAARQIQDEALATHTGKLSREDGEIDWSAPASDLERLVRAYDPWPGTTTVWSGEGGSRRLKIHPFVRPVVADPAGRGEGPGTVLESSSRLIVRCGDGALELSGDLQLEGRKRLSPAEFLRGHSLPVGTILGRA